MDSSTLSLSLAGADKGTPPLGESALLLQFTRSHAADERINMYAEVQEANPDFAVSLHFAFGGRVSPLHMLAVHVAPCRFL